MTSDEMITEQLAALKRDAPEDLLERVMHRADLADQYTEIDGPTGPAFVAWNGRGITAFVPVEAVGSRDTFEERHPRGVSYVEGPPPSLSKHLERTIETGRLGSLLSLIHI